MLQQQGLSQEVQTIPSKTITDIIPVRSSVFFMSCLESHFHSSDGSQHESILHLETFFDTEYDWANGGSTDRVSLSFQSAANVLQYILEVNCSSFFQSSGVFGVSDMLLTENCYQNSP